jgi:hypothetical protein
VGFWARPELFKPDIGEVPDVGGVRIVTVAEHGDIDQMCRCGILPDLARTRWPVSVAVRLANFRSMRRDRARSLEIGTHLRLTIVPNKNGSGTATLTALLLFA